MNSPIIFPNPFRPGAGHPPPYLAGRETETKEFSALLEQDPILTNLVLTGLRGVGKTVLLETFKPIALQSGWLWAGTDLSESASVSEDNVAIRLLADLSPLVANVVVVETEERSMGFGQESGERVGAAGFRATAPAFRGDARPRGGQTQVGTRARLGECGCDHQGARNRPRLRRGPKFERPRGDLPVSALTATRRVSVAAKKGLPFLLVLTGLPTLFPKLVAARTYTERMFHVTTLGRLSNGDSRDAILKPIQQQKCPVHFTPAAVEDIIQHSGGYPYFINSFAVKSSTVIYSNVPVVPPNPR